MAASMAASNLELQLSEVEMVRSMFPLDREMQLDDPLAEADARRWLLKYGSEDEENTAPPPPPRMSFNLALALTSDVTVTLRAQMTKGYPVSEMPELHLSCASFSRESQASANADLRHYLLAASDPGALVVGIAIAWVQDRGLEYIKSVGGDLKSTLPDIAASRSLSSCRLWIYSHHIYSKVKRKDILKLAGDFNISGFSLPGKPGIICLEGFVRDVEEVWGIIKSWQWQKIGVRIQEKEDEVENFRRFSGFQELGFVKDSEDCRHMDMGEFRSYLRQHDSDYVFKELFGLLNKTCED